jgi:Uma2 family endonuclease
MQPDLLIACDTDEKVNEKGRYMGTPTLVVEILSPSTQSKDMVDKLNTYMISGVKEFWVIDPKNETMLVYSFKNYEIDEFSAYGKEDIARSFVFEGLEVKGNDIFY